MVQYWAADHITRINKDTPAPEADWAEWLNHFSVVASNMETSSTEIQEVDWAVWLHHSWEAVALPRMADKVSSMHPLAIAVAVSEVC